MTELLILCLFAWVVWKLVKSERDQMIDDPLDLARPSVERLQEEAERALEELRAFGRNGE